MVLIRDIKQKIINDITPFMAQRGFIFHDGAWHADGKDLIKVIQIQHFNSNLARYFKTSTATFNLNLGIYYRFLSQPYGGKGNLTDQSYFPKEYECHVRRCLLRYFNQDAPGKELNQIDNRRKDIWYVKADSSDLEMIIEGVKRAIANEGIKWLEQFSDLSYALAYIKSGSIEGNTWEGKPFGLGAKDSPIRRSYIRDFASYLERGGHGKNM